MLVFLTVSVGRASPKPSVRQLEGISPHPYWWQAAGRLVDISHSHATESARIACNPLHPRRFPQTQAHRACNMPELHSYYLSPNTSQLSTSLVP